jgi:hypothetical protein
VTRPNPEGDDEGVRAEVLRLFERSDSLQTAAGAGLAQAVPPSTRKEFLATSIGAVSLEHWGAQRLLLREGLYVTGFALVRLQFEAVVRAIWILECAKADWLERFATPMADGQLEEPVLGPPVPAMLSAIATKAPVIAGMLSQLKEGAWEPMHSYVHGGVRPIAHSLAGTTHYQVSAVLRNANGLGLLAVNAMTIAFQDPRLGGFVARLQREYGDCLPPPKPLSP